MFVEEATDRAKDALNLEFVEDPLILKSPFHSVHLDINNGQCEVVRECNLYHQSQSPWRKVQIVTEKLDTL